MSKKIKICSDCGREHTDNYKDYCYRCYQKRLMRKLWSSDVSSVYTITNTATGKVYVGSTSRKPDQRWQNHKDTIFNPKERSYNTELKKEMRFFGLESFKFEVQLECEKKDQKFEEQQLIDELREQGFELYNSIDAVSKKEMATWRNDKLLAMMGLEK